MTASVGFVEELREVEAFLVWVIADADRTIVEVANDVVQVTRAGEPLLDGGIYSLCYGLAVVVGHVLCERHHTDLALSHFVEALLEAVVAKGDGTVGHGFRVLVGQLMHVALPLQIGKSSGSAVRIDLGLAALTIRDRICEADPCCVGWGLRRRPSHIDVI